MHIHLTASPRRPAARLLALLAVVSALLAAPLPAGTAHAAPTSYALHHNSDGTVVRWNPCAGIRYRVNTGGLPNPDLVTRDVRNAIARISQATGMHFFYQGTTGTVPQRSSKADPNVPLVIAWALPGTGPGRSDILDGRAVAYGGWRSLGTPRADGGYTWRIASGFVVLDKSKSVNGRAGFARDARGPLLLHELGHAVGLGHVSDRTQVMYPVMNGVTAYSDGDRNGLRRVGRPAGCIS